MIDGGRFTIPLEWWDRRPCVYRFYTDDGWLLYVGYSERLFQRTLTHRREVWFSWADRMVVQPFDTSDEAFAAEIKAIKTEQPICNVNGLDRSLIDDDEWWRWRRLFDELEEQTIQEYKRVAQERAAQEREHHESFLREQQQRTMQERERRQREIERQRRTLLEHGMPVAGVEALLGPS